jgi:hypothetical protein
MHGSPCDSKRGCDLVLRNASRSGRGQFLCTFFPPKILLFYFFHTVFLMDTQITVRHRHRPGESRIFQLRRVEVKIP